MTTDPTSPQTVFDARITALWVYPIKSCAGISLQQAVLTPTGLAHDRAWMVVDAEGDMVTQRELPRMVKIQPALTHDTLVLHAPGQVDLELPLTAARTTLTQVRVWDDVVPAFDMGPAASTWLTDFLGDRLGPLRLVRFDDQHARLSSDKWTQGVQALNQFSDGFPLLAVSKASLDELNSRLQAKGEVAVDMRRFRPNLVLDGVMAHDEDRIGTMTVDGVQLQPVKPCPRCPIPNIDPDLAQPHPAVSDTLQTYRQDARVNGAVTFGMNCIPLAGVGQVLRVGQRVLADWVF
ncbi:MAG: MOSC domain-containing protein [Limnohabitans sp.]|nr:MOSC domain-containing protein [Limnohabitans sp.]